MGRQTRRCGWRRRFTARAEWPGSGATPDDRLGESQWRGNRRPALGQTSSTSLPSQPHAASGTMICTPPSRPSPTTDRFGSSRSPGSWKPCRTLHNASGLLGGESNASTRLRPNTSAISSARSSRSPSLSSMAARKASPGTPRPHLGALQTCPPESRFCGGSAAPRADSAPSLPSFSHHNHPQSTSDDRVESDQVNRPVPCKHKGSRRIPETFGEVEVKA